ncbi:MAG: hypothetical protein JJE34_05195 [Alphaproteobacteria bacterium]|nr:hypothetical protein [Alphaproteobacteria bacterium]
MSSRLDYVTRSDYETVLIPAVKQALSGHKKVRLYDQIGPEFTGIEPGAMEFFPVAQAAKARDWISAP